MVCEFVIYSGSLFTEDSRRSLKCYQNTDKKITLFSFCSDNMFLLSKNVKQFLYKIKSFHYFIFHASMNHWHFLHMYNDDLVMIMGRLIVPNTTEFFIHLKIVGTRINGFLNPVTSKCGIGPLIIDLFNPISVLCTYLYRFKIISN